MWAGLGYGALGMVTAGAFTLAVQPEWFVRILQRREPRVLFLKDNEQELIVSLTIDDGPHEDITPELLDVLKENDSRATWFLIGSNIDSCPEMVERIHSEGHEVGNHTMRDCASWRLSQEELTDQLLATERRLERFFRKNKHGKLLKWFRPGHGFYSQEMIDNVESHGYKLALGSLYPLDTMFTDQGKSIAKYLLSRVYPGAIIVLHDRAQQKTQTVEVLRRLLPELKRRGYSVVTLSELKVNHLNYRKQDSEEI